MEDLALTSFIISIFVSSAVIGSFILNWYNHSKNRDEEHAKMVLEITNNFQKIDQSLFASKNMDELGSQIQNLANYADTVCHLLNLKKLDEKTGKFFRNFIWHAYGSIDDLIKQNWLATDRMDVYPELKKWCLINTIPQNFEPFSKRWKKAHSNNQPTGNT